MNAERIIGYYTWILSILGVFGAALNSSQEPCLVYYSFILWNLTNSGLIIISIKKKQWPYVFMFFAYLLTSINGLINS